MSIFKKNNYLLNALTPYNISYQKLLYTLKICTYKQPFFLKSYNHIILNHTHTKNTSYWNQIILHFKSIRTYKKDFDHNIYNSYHSCKATRINLDLFTSQVQLLFVLCLIIRNSLVYFYQTVEIITIVQRIYPYIYTTCKILKHQNKFKYHNNDIYSEDHSG